MNEPRVLQIPISLVQKFLWLKSYFYSRFEGRHIESVVGNMGRFWYYHIPENLHSKSKVFVLRVLLIFRVSRMERNYFDAKNTRTSGIGPLRHRRRLIFNFTRLAKTIGYRICTLPHGANVYSPRYSLG